MGLNHTLSNYGPWIAGALVLLYLMNSYGGSKSMATSSMMDKLQGSTGTVSPLSEQGPFTGSTHSVGGNAQPTETLQHRTTTGQSKYSESVLKPAELLPGGEPGVSLGSLTPGASEDLKGQNFLQAGYHTNTAVAGVSQTNRNPAWDIREEPPNPVGSVGPFLNTTIEPNPYRTGLKA